MITTEDNHGEIKYYKEVSSLQFIHCCENVLVERAMLVGERPLLDMH